MPEPGPKARYEIFRSGFNELLQYRAVSPLDQHITRELVPTETEQQPLELIPAYDVLRLTSMHERDSPGYKLWDIAERCEVIAIPGRVHTTSTNSVIQRMSARALRRLPLIAVVRYRLDTPCTIQEALSALSLAVQDEINAREIQGNPLLQFNPYA